MATPSKPQSDKPSPVGLNMDTMRREGARLDPFVVILDGYRYSFADPMELDWQELAACMTDPRMLIRLALPTDDAMRMLRVKTPTWKINAFSAAWQEHYGLNYEALGNGVASTS